MVNKGERESKFDDGDRFPQIMNVKDIQKDDRWYPPKDILREMGATQGDLVAWEKKGKYRYFIYVLNPELLKNVSISEKQGDKLLKELIKNMPDDIPIDGVDHVIQVRSHGRFGSKNKLAQIFREMGAEDEDWVFLEYVDNEDEGCGWYLSILKNSDIAPERKKVLEVKDNGMASSI